MILAIDTATRWLGLALHDETAVLAEVGWRCKNNHTIELTPSIQRLLARQSVDIDALTAIAVAIGPGSYTGLRVGLAVAKGLALAHRMPLIGVPTLDIVAAAIGRQPGQLVVAAEAGRTRVCTAVYQWHDAHRWQSDETPSIDTWANLLARLSGPTIFAGEISAKAAKQIKTANAEFTVAPATQSVRRAGYLAQIGRRRLRQNDVDDAVTLTPNYLREPAGA